ncbi:MAG: hypothetical protein EXR62_17875 [Chloroflexi bacterium]|nr:hypothetical protein [Chloroflexota bacterium]
MPKLHQIALLPIFLLLSIGVSWEVPNSIPTNLFFGPIDAVIYDGVNFGNLGSILYILNDNDLYAGRNFNDQSHVVFSLKGNSIFSGILHTDANRRYKVEGNHILPAGSSNISESVYSYTENAFYAGPQITDNNNRLFTRRGNFIFKGTSADLDEVILSFDGDFEKLRPFLPIIVAQRP